MMQNRGNLNVLRGQRQIRETIDRYATETFGITNTHQLRTRVVDFLLEQFQIWNVALRGPLI